MSVSFHCILVGGLSLLLPQAASALPPGFYPLGDLPGREVLSQARGISANGSVAVGTSISTFGPEAFRWTADGGIIGIGDLPGGGFTSEAFGVSPDGSVVVGVGTSVSGEASFRWTADTGMVEIAPSGGARAASSDGTVVVGRSSFQAYRWTEATGAVGLGDLPGGSFNSLAFDVSADGQFIVGHGASAAGTEAFRWTAETGMVSIGDLPGGPVQSEARGVSADGSVVVGFSQSASGQDAFRWTASEGMVNLGSGAATVSATDVSADGSIIVGAGLDGVFVWDEVQGLRSFRSIFGLDFSDWQSIRSEGISDDGTTIVGWGTHVSGQVEGWIAVLPEPSTLALLAVGGLIFARRGDRGRSSRGLDPVAARGP